MKINLFTTLAAMEMLKDKESIEIKIQRVGDEYAVLATPKINGKIVDLIISGTSEDLDDSFMAELKKPIEKIKGLKSNAETAEPEDDEDTIEGKDAVFKKNAAAATKAGSKKDEKKPSKSKTPKKDDSEKETEESEKEESEEKTDQEIDADLTAENAQEKAEQEAADKAKVEAEEKQKAELAAEQEALNKKKEKFTALIAEGDESFDKRMYEVAEASYKKASDLFPEDEKISDKYKKTKQYVDRLIDAGILTARKEA